MTVEWTINKRMNYKQKYASKIFRTEAIKICFICVKLRLKNLYCEILHVYAQAKFFSFCTEQWLSFNLANLN